MREGVPMHRSNRPENGSRKTRRPVLRRAEPADATGIGDVFLAARAAMSYLPRLHSDERTRAWIAHVVLVECKVCVAEIDGRIVGFAALRGRWLEHLYVDPAHQGLGIGSELLESAITARGARLELRVFEQNEGAARFYERHGFSRVHRGDGGDNEEGLPDLHYRREA
jgi:GNAT superfamily N-acetyltransferase